MRKECLPLHRDKSLLRWHIKIQYVCLSLHITLQWIVTVVLNSGRPKEKNNHGLIEAQLRTAWRCDHDHGCEDALSIPLKVLFDTGATYYDEDKMVYTQLRESTIISCLLNIDLHNFDIIVGLSQLVRLHILDIIAALCNPPTVAYKWERSACHCIATRVYVDASKYNTCVWACL